MGKILTKKLIERFNASKNINNKKILEDILIKIKNEGFFDASVVVSSIGEDSAAINVLSESESESESESDTYVLVTTDSILPEFMIKSPWAAGFSCIYVGFEDISVCGGLPVACSITLSYNNKNNRHFGDEIMKGVIDGTNKFRVPLIRGHTTPDSDHFHLSSTIIGRVKKDMYLSSRGTKPNDRLLLVMDLDGNKGKNNPNYWDTITKKSSDEIYLKRGFIRKSIRQKLINSCKDIANGGVLGTIWQLISYSKLDLSLNLDLSNIINSIPDKFPYSLDEFLFNFLTSSYVVSVPEDNIIKLESLVKSSKMYSINCGFFQSSKSKEDRAIIFHYSSSNLENEMDTQDIEKFQILKINGL